MSLASRSDDPRLNTTNTATARRTAVVTGAGTGIGRRITAQVAVRERLAAALSQVSVRC
ncbi:hypothetical protein OG785_21315 [Streptomyces sp. NBC_00006]|uniref:hypothetical protein n=1 Tax=Streptomyces sp. NBC_00006 TaxID=2975619 RepID=UPI00224CDEDC|nr:hypothetical protein [Streptomyces sp. NBC_00006]MCX5533085.1 hypothetical protein [Streptomyces sp. NBC_00006]